MKRLTKEMRRILVAMDVDAALKNSTAMFGTVPTTREIAEAGMHKARLLAGGAFTREQREQSRQWLRDHYFNVPGRR